MKLLDCTLRDGANVIGNGFPADLTRMMIEHLIEANIPLIEMGNCLGIGAYEADQSHAPLTDGEYGDLITPYRDRAEIGMFVGWKNAGDAEIQLAVDKGLHFLRVGANAGDGAQAVAAIKRIKAAGLTCRYSMMKGYICSASDLAMEAAMLAAAGLDEVTLMDSAGTMLPAEVHAYVTALTAAVDIPVGFHGHNNLGLSVANALSAAAAGAAVLDCGLMGMARSAGNLPTEVAVAVFQRQRQLMEVDGLHLLHFIDDQLAPAMKKYDYRSPITPLDVVYGLAGCHSSFAARFEKVAAEKKVDLYRLIIAVSREDRKAPSLELIERVADQLVEDGSAER